MLPREVDAPLRRHHVAVKGAPLTGHEPREGAAAPAVIVPAPARRPAHFAGPCELRMYPGEGGEGERAPLGVGKGGEASRGLAPGIRGEEHGGSSRHLGIAGRRIVGRVPRGGGGEGGKGPPTTAPLFLLPAR